MQKKNKKICLAASSGGHLEQLITLAPYLMEYDKFFVTEKTKYDSMTKDRKVYLLKQTNRREIMCIPNLIINSFKSMYILIKEKPDVVITTGVLSVIPLALLAKLFRKKLIYIESYAKIDDATLSGKLLYKFADAFYVQWPEMLKIFPNAKYVGGIY